MLTPGSGHAASRQYGMHRTKTVLSTQPWLRPRYARLTRNVLDTWLRPGASDQYESQTSIALTKCQTLSFSRAWSPRARTMAGSGTAEKVRHLTLEKLSALSAPPRGPLVHTPPKLARHLFLVCVLLFVGFFPSKTHHESCFAAPPLGRTLGLLRPRVRPCTYEDGSSTIPRRSLRKGSITLLQLSMSLPVT